MICPHIADKSHERSVQSVFSDVRAAGRETPRGFSDTRKAVGTLILGSHRLIIVPYQFWITTPSQAPGLNVPLASTVPVLLTVPPVKLAPGATARMLPLT